jgi:hypothetical protein
MEQYVVQPHPHGHGQHRQGGHMDADEHGVRERGNVGKAEADLDDQGEGQRHER